MGLTWEWGHVYKNENLFRSYQISFKGSDSKRSRMGGGMQLFCIFSYLDRSFHSMTKSFGGAMEQGCLQIRFRAYCHRTHIFEYFAIQNPLFGKIGHMGSKLRFPGFFVFLRKTTNFDKNCLRCFCHEKHEFLRYALHSKCVRKIWCDVKSHDVTWRVMKWHEVT